MTGMSAAAGAAIEAGLGDRVGLDTRLVACRGARALTKADLLHNDYLPEITIEPDTYRVTVAGDLYRRDGINYLLISRVVTDEGIVNRTHDDYGIQPGGN